MLGFNCQWSIIAILKNLDGTVDSNTYLTAETSHNDVLVDGDFGSEGFLERGATEGSYSIDTNTYLTSYTETDTLDSVTEEEILQQMVFRLEL